MDDHSLLETSADCMNARFFTCTLSSGKGKEILRALLSVLLSFKN
jgi:hypothetical protein